VLRSPGELLSSVVASQVAQHRPFGGVVPEVASRNHIVAARPAAEAALAGAGLGLSDIDAFAATAGPGLASSLLVGNSLAKALAVATGKPFVAVNHLEGHLLSPFLGDPGGVRPCTALVVSGGHTLLVALDAPGRYRLLGATRDDAAGEAFDKVGKLLGLPYPGGPQVEALARSGDPDAFDFPRSMLAPKGNLEFSFSGLKTAMLYTLRDLGGAAADRRADLAASFQQAVVDVLVEKTTRAARAAGSRLVTVSGGVACNRALREAFEIRCQREGLELLVAPPALTTDNAAMIAFAAAAMLARGLTSPLDHDVDPNLRLVG
jgi:N6-L-threonylcarbamoyladenine synthase